MQPGGAGRGGHMKLYENACASTKRVLICCHTGRVETETESADRTPEENVVLCGWGRRSPVA